MATNIDVPQLDPAMTEARVVRWLKSEGEFVEKGEAILEIETDKALVEIEAPIDGVMGPMLWPEKSVVAVGEVLTYLLTPGEAGPNLGPVGRIVASEGGRVEGSEKARENPEAIPRSEIRSSPYARRLAEELHIDLTGLHGSGDGGRITAEDVKRVAGQARTVAQGEIPVPPRPEAIAAVVPMQGVRAITASRMHDSHRNTAPVTLMVEADASALTVWRDRLNSEHKDGLGHSIGFNDLLIHVVAEALRQFPYMNARLDVDAISLLGEIHVGLAIDTERGLMVPVVRNADRKSVVEISRELRTTIDNARSGRLKLDELGGGTFTISNLGMFEVESFTPIINMPEAAILGVGVIKDRAVVASGRVLVSKTAWLSLTFDHRLVDGAAAARFLQHIKHQIENADRQWGAVDP